MGLDGFQLVFMSWRKFRNGFVEGDDLHPPKSTAGTWGSPFSGEICGLKSSKFLGFHMNSPSNIEIYWNQQQGGFPGLRIQTKGKNHGSGKQGLEDEVSLQNL